TIELVVFDVRAIGERPATPGLEVLMPRQRRAERCRSRAQQIELVAAHGLGGADRLAARLGIDRGKLRRDPVALRRLDEERLPHQVLPKFVDITGAKRLDERSFGEEPRIQKRPGAPRAPFRRLERAMQQIAWRTPEGAPPARE